MPWSMANRKGEAEWRRIVAGAALARSAGLEVHAGHGLDYATASRSAACRHRRTHIGYYMMGEALFVGIGEDRARDAGRDGSGRKNLESLAGENLASKT